MGSIFGAFSLSYALFQTPWGRLAGSVEASGGGGFVPGGGGAAGGAIEDGKIDGSLISFRTGNTAYTGTVNGDQIELRRTGGPGGRGRGPPPAAEVGLRPAIGPPPADTDPSFGAGGGARARRSGARSADTEARESLITMRNGGGLTQDAGGWED